jgi:hypothetical protein
MSRLFNLFKKCDKKINKRKMKRKYLIEDATSRAIQHFDSLLVSCFMRNLRKIRLAKKRPTAP